MLAVRLSKQTETRLNKLCEKTHKTKSYYVKKAIETMLEDEEDLADAISSYENYLRSGKKGFSIDELKAKYEID